MDFAKGWPTLRRMDANMGMCGGWRHCHLVCIVGRPICSEGKEMVYTLNQVSSHWMFRQLVNLGHVLTSCFTDMG